MKIDREDEIVIKSLKSSMIVLEDQLKRLSSYENLKPYQLQDQKDWKKALKAMLYVYDYYGGNLR